VAASAAEACAAAVGDRKLSLRVEPPPRPLRIGVDGELGERILQPVIENACRYGRSAVSVSLGQSDGTVAYLVEDDGPGVDDEEREAIFEPGSRGRAGSGDGTSGAGLGLALARRLARSVAGDVVATSDGFRITLPRG
jgi:signal transduction histidine kinase